MRAVAPGIFTPLSTGEDVKTGPWQLCQNEIALLNVSWPIKRRGWGEVQGREGSSRLKLK